MNKIYLLLVLTILVQGCSTITSQAMKVSNAYCPQTYAARLIIRNELTAACAKPGNLCREIHLHCDGDPEELDATDE